MRDFFKKGGGRSKGKSSAPTPPPGSFSTSGRQAAVLYAVQSKKKGATDVYTMWKKAVEARGGNPTQRLEQFMLNDLQLMAGMPAPVAEGNPTTGEATNGGVNLGMFGEQLEAQAQELPTGLGSFDKAAAKVQDAYASVEIATQLSEQVTQLAARFTQIIAHNTTAMEEITNKYAELATRLEGAPDFRQWATMLTELNQRVQTLEITMKSAVETLNQIADNFNKAVETLNAYQKTITDAIVGRLQQYIDNAVANLLNELSQRLQPQAFTEQQAQTIAQLVVDLLIKRKVAR
jgi:uncharacterized protein Yka (UPF0111/DUF47 family)